MKYFKKIFIHSRRKTAPFMARIKRGAFNIIFSFRRPRIEGGAQYDPLLIPRLLSRGVRKGFIIYLVITFCISLINPGAVYSLSPDGKGILDKIGRIPRDGLRRFQPGLRIDTSLPYWLRGLSDISKAEAPLSPPDFPFPNMEYGIGVSDPHWLKLSVISASILEMCPSQGDSIKLELLRRKVKDKFRAYRIPYKNIEFIALLNNLRRISIVKNEEGSDFTLSSDSEIELLMPPRMLAVWADDIFYIAKDIANALVNEAAAEVFADYAGITEKWRLYPVEANYPVLKAITGLSEGQQRKIVTALSARYDGEKKSPLIDSILLLLDYTNAMKGWLLGQAPNLCERTIYSVAAEITLLAGGLGRVMQYHGNGLKSLGLDVVYIEPKYRKDKDNNPIDYNNLPLRIKDLRTVKKQSGEDERFKIIFQKRAVFFKVWTGINENDIPVYLIEPENPYYAEQLYVYRDGYHQNAIGSTEFTEFFAKATLEVIRFIELEKKRRLGAGWKAPVVDANDGQIAALSAWARICYSNGAGICDEYGSRAADADETADIFNQTLFNGTTHTYKNRVIEWNFDGGLDYLKNAGIPEEYAWLFLCVHEDDYGNKKLTWDFTSGGLRSADCKKGVSAVHAYEAGKFDPGIMLYGITNGDDIGCSSKYFRECMSGVGISPLKYPFLSPCEIQKIKRKAKEEIELDPSQMTVSYSGRLVPEKAGRERAFTDVNIIEMVKAGIQVVIYGNIQASSGSRAIAYDLSKLSERINALKGEHPGQYPGRFIFKDKFDIIEQKQLLAATDIQAQYSNRATGAAEYTEADVSANGGLQLSPPYWEGIINKQGIPINWDEFTGNTLVPKDTSRESFLEQIMLAFSAFQDGNLFRLQANSIQLSRILRASLTSAGSARLWNSTIEAGIKQEVKPRILGEIRAVKPSDIIVSQSADGEKKRIRRTGDDFNAHDVKEVQIEVTVDLIAYHIKDHSRKENIPAKMVVARIADKFGKIIPLEFKEEKDGRAVFTTKIRDFPIDGNIEVSSGLWWEKTPIRIVSEPSANELERIENAMRGNFMVKQILPHKADIAVGSEVELKDNEPVVFQVEFPCASEKIAEQIVPILHTNVSSLKGAWDNAGTDEFLFSEHKYMNGKVIWTFGFIPKNSGEFTFCVRLKNAPSFFVWYAGRHQNIIVKRIPLTPCLHASPHRGDGERISGEVESLGEGFVRLVNTLKLIFYDVEFPTLEEIRAVDIEKVKKDFIYMAMTKEEKEIAALLGLVGGIMEEVSLPETKDDVKLLATLAVSGNILRHWKGLSFTNIALLWDSLSQIGYAKYFADIVRGLMTIKEKRDSTEFSPEESILLYFLHSVIGEDMKCIVGYRGMDRDIADTVGILLKLIKNNMRQWEIFKGMKKEGMKKEEISGVIAQDIQDLGPGVNNWLRGIKNHKIDIQGVQMVYLLAGVDSASRARLMKMKPRGVMFAEKIEDVEGENIVYLTRSAGERENDLKKKGIKLIERGNCGPILELAFALDLLGIGNMYDDEGKLNSEAISLYITFLVEMKRLSLIDGDALARYTGEIRNFGYIRLPEIKQFEDMWHEMPLFETYA